MSNNNRPQIDALENAMETYLRAILHVQYNCPATRIRTYLNRKHILNGLCYFFTQKHSLHLFNPTEIPRGKMLYLTPRTARPELFFDKIEYRNEVVRLLMLRFDYLEKLYFKYSEANGL